MTELLLKACGIFYSVLCVFSIVTGLMYAGGAAMYAIAVGFTVFSICSVAFKLKGKINLFPVLKCIAYVAILVVLLMARGLFF